MKYKLLTIIAVIGIIPCSAIAARPSINSLQQEINVLNARIDALESRPGPPQAYDGNGALIGTVLSEDMFLRVINDKDYLFGIDKSDGQISYSTNLFYESTDCSTQPYGNISGLGNVFDIEGPNYGTDALYYMPLDATPVYINVVAGGSGCGPAGPMTGLMAPLYPNDPNVTGVSSGVFTLPIRILQ